MVTVIKDRAGIFGKRQIVLSSDEKDVFRRIGRLFVKDPGAVEALLRKYNVVSGSESYLIPKQLMALLAHKIADDDEEFNLELATLLAQPRFSRLDPLSITALISGIAAVLGGGMGLAKSGVDKRSQAETIQGQIRLTAMQQQEAEKKRKTQITLLVVGFLLLIITVITIFLFKGLNK